jgi:hypothetical protein
MNKDLNQKMNTEKKDIPISMLTASLGRIKYIASRQPYALKSATSFLKQEDEKKKILTNTIDNHKIYS